MKPIEPGCRAIIVKSAFPSNLGKVVTVVTHDPHCARGLIWEVECKDPLEGCAPGKTPGWNLRSWCRTECLMRIDDYAPEGMNEQIQDKLIISKLKEAAR